MTCATERPYSDDMPDSNWNIESTLVPEKKMHLVEVAVLSFVLVMVGTLMPYMTTATFEVIESSVSHLPHIVLKLL